MSWLACEQPERPPDAGVRYHLFGCRGCLIAAQTAAEHDPSYGRILTRDLLQHYHDTDGNSYPPGSTISVSGP